MAGHLLALQLLAVTLAAVGARPLDDDNRQSTTDKPDGQPRDPCERLRTVVKKIIPHVDHLSELDHQDYVVGDREYELVLKRIDSGVPVCRTDGRLGGRDETDVSIGAPGEHEQGDECPICLEEFGETSALDSCAECPAEITLPCRHHFHLSCIEDWAGARQPRSGRCPICIALMRRQDGRRPPDQQ